MGSKINVTSEGVRFVNANDLLKSDNVKALMVKMSKLRAVRDDSRRRSSTASVQTRQRKSQSASSNSR